MKVIVLGAGLVGVPMAVDLARDSEFEVSIADVSSRALSRCDRQPAIKTIQSDLSLPGEVKSLVAGFDMVVSAVPGFMGFQTLKSILEAGKDVVDIAFCPEDPFELDGLAKERGVTAIVDCGVAPGMSNVLVGHADALLDRTDQIAIYVGGLPEVREWPYEYKAPFSPIDVIEEYVRPARMVENGRLVVRPALSEPELIDVPGVGTLEAFNTDGLRTLVTTMNVPNMKEKTMRYPGHIEKMRLLRETGFFSQEEIEVRGARIRPIDLTSRLLFAKWEYAPGERDVTAMQITVEGVRSEQRLRYRYDLVDRYDAASGTSSMARATGYAATMTVRLVANGMYSRKGLSAPEHVGRHPGCVEFLLKGLGDRGLIYRETVEKLS